MRIATATIKGISPYSQGRAHCVPRGDKETADDHERRTWRERLHVNEETGFVFIPPSAFKNMMGEIAKFLSIQIPGKGKSTYTKHFESGVMVVEPLVLPVKKSDVAEERVFVPSDGRQGGGKRVWKHFPVIHKWGGDVPFIITDDAITPDIFLRHLEQAGSSIGIGRFRPRNRGYYGRFAVEKVAWA